MESDDIKRKYYDNMKTLFKVVFQFCNLGTVLLQTAT